jgi:hypothetical protein
MYIFISNKILGSHLYKKGAAELFFKIEYDDNVIIIFIYFVFLDDKEKSNTIGALLVFLAALLMTMSF